jgi:hypothetical protein
VVSSSVITSKGEVFLVYIGVSWLGMIFHILYTLVRSYIIIIIEIINLSPIFMCEKLVLELILYSFRFKINAHETCLFCFEISILVYIFRHNDYFILILPLFILNQPHNFPKFFFLLIS